ncbi:hypothetical protein V1477_006224 [Vespula maculifrons]|uniref:Uncharacterized protein n=1 Tax=Vespula maculifrons TaxID=7453 RepID=A0ABD2CKM5_VESMC
MARISEVCWLTISKNFIKKLLITSLYRITLYRLTMVCIEILLENYCLRNPFKSNSITYSNKKYIQVYQNVRFLHVKDDKIEKSYFFDSSAKTKNTEHYQVSVVRSTWRPSQVPKISVERTIFRFVSTFLYVFVLMYPYIENSSLRCIRSVLSLGKTYSLRNIK